MAGAPISTLRPCMLSASSRQVGRRTGWELVQHQHPPHRQQVVAVQDLHKAGHLLHPRGYGAWGAATAHLHSVHHMRWWQGMCRSSLQQLKLAGMHRYGVATVPRRGLTQPTPTVGASFINPEGHHLPAPAPATALGANPQCRSVPPDQQFTGSLIRSHAIMAGSSLYRRPVMVLVRVTMVLRRAGRGCPCVQLCGEAGANTSRAER